LCYTGQIDYELEVAGLKRRLPVVKVGENLWIASFVMLGDVQLNNICGAALAAEIMNYDCDILVGPEAKVLPLLQVMATFLGHLTYVVCRKSIKAYMENPLIVSTRSITTTDAQKLVLDGVDVEKVRGRRVAIVDDVVSTGGSINAVEELILQAGGEVVCRAAVLKEGDSYQKDLIYLGKLPVFTR